MPRVLISDKMSGLAAEVFQRRGIEVDVKTGLTPEDLSAIIGDYDGLAVRSSTKVRGPVIEAAKNLKVIGRAGIGVDNVDLNAATAKGIVVMNTPFGNSITTAEHAIAMLLALAREQKVDLANISILQLAEQYLSYIEQARELDLDIAARCPEWHDIGAVAYRQGRIGGQARPVAGRDASRRSRAREAAT